MLSGVWLGITSRLQPELLHADAYTCERCFHDHEDMFVTRGMCHLCINNNLWTRELLSTVGANERGINTALLT